MLACLSNQSFTGISGNVKFTLTGDPIKKIRVDQVQGKTFLIIMQYTAIFMAIMITFFFQMKSLIFKLVLLKNRLLELIEKLYLGGHNELRQSMFESRKRNTYVNLVLSDLYYCINTSVTRY